jgi:DNA (cytosine-5)-methyltransferase 1
MVDGRPIPTFYEFFAGGGMARAALTSAGLRCLFANDFDAKKVSAYIENWGAGEMRAGDVGKLKTSDLPGRADLVWASFPCQDLSLAGGGAGLKGDRSGTFWPFWKLVRGLKAEGRAPTTVVLENVCGALTSHGGRDFHAICGALAEEGYSVGALVMDAAQFVPQSRPRLFVVGTLQSLDSLGRLVAAEPVQPWHSKALVAAYEALPAATKGNWVWWNLPPSAGRSKNFSDIVEESPNDQGWHTPQETAKLLAMMSPINRKKVDTAQKSGRLEVGTIYRRTRWEGDDKVQRAEVRFDEVAGCLRTPAGGSSRQILMFVNGGRVRTRLISARETARLMGLPDSYVLPARYNEAYHLTGDGVAVPVVEFLANQLLRATVQPGPEQMVA